MAARKNIENSEPNANKEVGWHGKPVAPLAIIQLERRDQLKLCDDLELIADQLPDGVDNHLFGAISDRLRINLPVYLHNEECLFDCLNRHGSTWLDLPAVLECIRHEHTVQICYVGELQDNLSPLRRGRDITNPEMTGYMLRSFFMSLRRHLAWEDLAVIPLASQLLTAADLTDLSAQLDCNRKAISPVVV